MSALAGVAVVMVSTELRVKDFTGRCLFQNGLNKAWLGRKAFWEVVAGIGIAAFSSSGWGLSSSHVPCFLFTAH